MKILAHLSIALAVTSAWLACLGLSRLRDPLDRLHCVTFCNLVGGFMLLLAVLLDDGITSRSLKVSLILLISIVAGAATSHATGRALSARKEEA